jgi:hypothetical protein
VNPLRILVGVLIKLSFQFQVFREAALGRSRGLENLAQASRLLDEPADEV